MLFRPQIAKPGTPLALTAGGDLISDGNYRLGAVLMGPGSFLIGRSAFPATYARGVISFWANYDSSQSRVGDSAKILNAFGASVLNSTKQSICSFNSLGPNSSAKPTAMGCVGIFLNQTTVDLYLRDGLTGAPLVGCSIDYADTSNATFGVQWINMGPLSSATPFPFSYNGNTFSVPPFSSNGAGIPGACGGGLIANITNINHVTQVCNFDSPSQLPTSPTIGQTATVGPSTFNIVTLDQFQGDVWLATSTVANFVTISGWHHYICSFDTSQLVTDANGNQCIRVQWAIDRGGGPIVGGPVMDTMAASVGPTSQPMSILLECSGTTGVLVTEPRNGRTDSDAWVIKSPLDAKCKWAYMYFGIPRNAFFDLTAARPQGGINLDYFITPALQAQNLGYQGTSVTPCAAEWMHTGDTTVLVPSSNAPYFDINNAATIFNPGATGEIFNTDSIWTEIGLPLVSSNDAPPVPSI